MSQHQVTKITENQVVLPSSHWLHKAPTLFGVIGVIALIAAFALGMGNMEQFHFSFHVAFIYFLSIALGGLFFVILQFATKSGWSVVVRRFAENIMGTMPLFLLLFVVMIFGMHTLYHWTHEEAVLADPILSGKSAYLNEKFFFIRTAIYFIAWLGLARFFMRKSAEQDKSGSQANTRAMQNMSYPGIALFALSTTFAAFDWIMSLNPHWYSTIFGVYFFAGCVVSIYATLILMISFVRGPRFLSDVISTEHFHDMGKMLFAFVVFWTYIAFSQFFLIWYSNIPEEQIFYFHRIQGSWKTVSICLACGHFVIPFFFLLSRHIKRNPKTLFLGAAYMLFIHYVDIFWLVMPNFQKEGASFGLVDICCIVGIGGLFVALFAKLMKRNAVVPFRDPRLGESLLFENL